MCSIWDPFMTAPCENQIQQNDLRGAALTGGLGEYCASVTSTDAPNRVLDASVCRTDARDLCGCGCRARLVIGNRAVQIPPPRFVVNRNPVNSCKSNC